jgi:tetratricopeptide (TPR) repeat protein
MSTKDELLNWHYATLAFEQGDITQAIKSFRQVGNYAKVSFNLGMIFSNSGNHESAALMYAEAIELDPYLACAYFQLGYTEFVLERYKQSMKHFSKCIELTKHNECIDYAAIGLRFKLYRA